MKIAVTYNNGEIFQHFGKTETFKIYEVENQEIQSSTILNIDESGHYALAALLASETIDVLICGGIGDGAREALDAVEIQVVSGAEGNADAAVEAYLKGELVSAGTTCDHHHGETEEGCSEEACAGCGHNCHTPSFTGKNVGKVMRVHYRGTFNDGTQFDASYDRGQPLEFTCGAGQMIRGFDAAVANLEVGEEVDVHLMPEDAYGMADPDAIFTVEIAQLPGSENLTAGQQVYLANQMGQPFPVRVVEKDDVNITFDANHEMAGKELNFHIEVVEIK